MSISNSRQGYRLLLRTAAAVFKQDTYALSQGKIKLREEFMKHKDVGDPSALSDLYKGIEEVDEMLRFNIVQGTLNERGNFDVKLTPENQVTVESKKNEPLGAELEPLDGSVAGHAVRIDKVQNRKK